MVNPPSPIRPAPIPKPAFSTAGSLSLAGTVPLCERFDTIGPLAHSVEDCALLLAALSGGPAADLAGADLSGTRLAVLETVALDELRDRPAQGFEDAVARLGRAGAQVTRITAPEVTEALALAGAVREAVRRRGRSQTANPTMPVLGNIRRRRVQRVRVRVGEDAPEPAKESAVYSQDNKVEGGTGGEGPTKSGETSTERWLQAKRRARRRG